MNQLNEQRVRKNVLEELKRKESIDRITANIDRIENVLNVCLESLESEIRDTGTDQILIGGVAEIAAQLLQLQTIRYAITSQYEHYGQ